MENYAIVDVSGAQCKVIADGLYRVPKLEAEVGAKVKLDKVLLWNDGKKVHVGTPYIQTRTVHAEVVEHGRGAKIIVFKKKRRKGYRRKRGHRQHYTDIRVTALPR